MALSTYTLDDGAAASVDPIFNRYSAAFRTAVESAVGTLIPNTDTAANLDLQLFDANGEAFQPAGFEGAYVTNPNAQINDPTLLIFANPDNGPGPDKGVIVQLDGDDIQFVGGTDFGDVISVKVSPGDEEMFIDAGIGDDTVVGGNAADTLIGHTGEDQIRGGRGDDSIDGGDGDDELWGGSDDDVIAGGDDNDTIYGDSGDDMLMGNDGDDSILGGTGATTVDGGAGFDVAVIRGKIKDFFWDDENDFWTDGISEISNTEFVRLDGNKVLITVGDSVSDAGESEADVARLFQMLTNADPTADQLHQALIDFNNGEGLTLSDIATTIVEGIDDDGFIDNVTDLGTYVAFLVNNAFDGTPGAPTVASLVADLTAPFTESGDPLLLLRSEIAGQVVKALSAADEHIHIAISPGAGI